MSAELIILTRSYDFLRWLLPRTEKFPRLYRHTIVKRLQDGALNFQEAILAAQSFSGKSRIAHLRQADAALNQVRLYLRLAHDWEWLSAGQYEHVSRMVDELGRLLGGWMRQTGTRKS